MRHGDVGALAGYARKTTPPTDQRAETLVRKKLLKLKSVAAPESSESPISKGGYYELRVISQDSFDTTRSIWTFVTNQRRILDDNAPKNSRSENQLVVVKIPPWLFAVLVQKGHHKVKNVSFFTNAFETLGTRWRAGRLEVTGSHTRTSCGMYSYKRQARTLASSRFHRSTKLGILLELCHRAPGPASGGGCVMPEHQPPAPSS